MIGKAEYDTALRRALPARGEVRPPRPDSEQPYFSSWLTQQLVDRYRPGVVFGGGLRIKTTLDPELQTGRRAGGERQARPASGPTPRWWRSRTRPARSRRWWAARASTRRPFNLATNGHRQPGSAFKPFTLIAALKKGISPDATFTSKKKVLGSDFVVNNYEDSYAGVRQPALGHRHL